VSKGATVPAAIDCRFDRKYLIHPAPPHTHAHARAGVGVKD
jgi:hypothetical protein